MPDEQMYGIKIKTVHRYHYRGKLYKRGDEYAVSRDLRDHLVGSGFFIDTVVSEPIAIGSVEPLAAGSVGAEPEDTEGMKPGAPRTKSNAKSQGVKIKREPSAQAVEV